MAVETYNGWKNYPTWAVNLWLTNDQGTSEMLAEIASEEYADAPNCLQVRDGIWTVDEARRYNTADHIREFVEEMLAQADEPQYGMSADLLGYALGQVEWQEIADAALQAWIEGLEYA